jgi:hypothetical protein
VPSQMAMDSSSLWVRTTPRPDSSQNFRIFVVPPRARAKFTLSSVPALPPTTSTIIAYGDLAVRGVCFVGSRGWLYFDDTAVRSPKGDRGEPIVWRTDNDGRSWRLVNAGRPQSPPPPD